jgi:hypothetical protein
MFYWEYLVYPPYTADLTPNNFHFYAPLKKHYDGKYFWSDDEVKAEMHQWYKY